MKTQLSFLLLSFICLLYLYLCPYSKVEESFNLQATHDLYYHGLTPALIRKFQMTRAYIRNTQLPLKDSLPYDHLSFPGVVPRTFTGPFILSSILHIITWALRTLSFHRIQMDVYPLLVQFFSRGILLTFNLHAHRRLAQAVDHRFQCNGILQAYYFIVTTVQFHLPYYSSRMLPNVFALILVIHAYAEWFNLSSSTYKPPSYFHPRVAVYLVVATIVFRCDVVLLLGTIGITLCFIQRLITFWDAIQLGISTSILALVVSGILDAILWFPQDFLETHTAYDSWTSFFFYKIWKRILFWPEGMVFMFNAVENKSSEYGISPWYWYFASAIPKGVLGTGLFLPFAFCKLFRRSLPSRGGFLHNMDMDILPFLVPCLLFVGLYSFLPHKEIRFIFVILPMMNVTAAKGLVYLHNTILQSMQKMMSLKKDDDREADSTFNWILLRKRVMTGSVIKIFCYVLFVLGPLLLSLVSSLVFVAVSRENYPGGKALEILFQDIAKSNSTFTSNNPCMYSSVDGTAQRGHDINIYIDVAASMTGISLFGQRSVANLCERMSKEPSVSCSFIKAGYELEHHQSLDQYNLMYLITEQSDVLGFRTIGKAQGFPKLRRFSIVTDDAIFVMRNDNCL